VTMARMEAGASAEAFGAVATREAWRSVNIEGFSSS
jgi:hypothetical protein